VANGGAGAAAGRPLPANRHAHAGQRKRSHMEASHLSIHSSGISREYSAAACVSKAEVKAYFWGLREGYVIFFEEARPLKRQLTIKDLYSRFGIVPPQSYRYVTGACIALLSDERVQASDRHERGHWARRRPTRSGVAR
jgi:hypothetical protein